MTADATTTTSALAGPKLPAMMRAAVLRDGADGLDIIELPVPQPRAGEALVRVRACGVCHTDLHVIKGEVAFPRPAVLGHEISGTIVAFGDDADAPAGTSVDARAGTSADAAASVSATDADVVAEADPSHSLAAKTSAPGASDAPPLAVGDEVVSAFIMPCTTCAACQRGRDDLCAEFFGQNRLRGTLYDGRSRLSMPDGSFLAMYSMGGLAEYAVVPVAALTPLPESLDPVESSILGCAAFTSYGAVHRAARIEPGEAVAIVAVGGIGSAVLQVARAAGADPIIAIDVAPDKLDAASALGATHTIDSTVEDPVARVRDLTDGRGVDAAFEALGRPATFEQAMRLLADGGRMVAIGIAAGDASARVEITPLVRRGTTITGSFGARTRQDLPAVVRLAAEGGFDAGGMITRRYRLEQADEAYRALAAGEITGRAVIEMR